MRSHASQVCPSINSTIWDQSLNAWTPEAHIQFRLQQLPRLRCVLRSPHSCFLLPTEDGKWYVSPVALARADVSSHPGWAASRVEQRSQRKDIREQGEKIYQGWGGGDTSQITFSGKPPREGKALPSFHSQMWAQGAFVLEPCCGK